MNIQRTVMFILLFAVVLRIDTGSETPPSSLDHRPELQASPLPQMMKGSLWETLATVSYDPYAPTFIPIFSDTFDDPSDILRLVCDTVSGLGTILEIHEYPFRTFTEAHLLRRPHPVPVREWGSRRPGGAPAFRRNTKRLSCGRGRCNP